MYLLSKFFFSDYFLLIPIFIIGVIASFEDFKYGKIKNKWIKIGFLWGLGIFALYIFWNFFFFFLEYFKIAHVSAFFLKFSYLGEVFLNTTIALMVGFLMWRWNTWSAGDAKLFALFSFLLPLKFYANTYLSYFPSFALLVNIFVIALGIFLITLSWTFFHWFFEKKKKNLSKEEKNIQKKKNIEKLFSLLKEILNLIVIFFVMVSFFPIFFKSWFGKNLIYFFTITLSLEKWVLFIAFLGFFILLMKSLQKIKKVFYIAAIILFIWLFYAWIKFGQSPLLAIKPMLGITAILVFGGFIFRKAFDWHVNKKEIQEIDIKNLQIYMRLTEGSLDTLKEKDKELFEKSIGKIYPDGLTKKQVLFLKEYTKTKKITKLEIYKLSPFAILIFIGLIATIICKGSIIQSFLK